jgi:acyl-CoA reductase-like NAD-dependent aldehyde dehydrogenase
MTVKDQSETLPRKISSRQDSHNKISPSMFLAGQWADSTQRITIRNPYDNTVIGSVPCANREQIELALQKAKEYANKPLNEQARAELLDAWARQISVNIEPLATLLCRENGKAITQARAEVKRAVDTITCYSNAARNLNEEAHATLDNVINGSPKEIQINNEGFVTAILYQPIGVITAYTPFNFPANTLVHKVAAAIASGNSIVVKPSEKTPLVALELARLFATTQTAPSGIVSVLTGHHQDFTELFLTSDDVDFFSMTGNSDVGQKLYRQFCNAQSFKKSHFELGGNAPQIVLEDFDVQKAASMLCSAVFDHNGSRCTTPRKILLPAGKFADDFSKLAANHADHWLTGDPLNENTLMGSLIDEAAAKAVESRVMDAIEQGAKLLKGGQRKGAVMQATVLSGVTPNMRIFKEENFGPVMCLLSYESLDEAVTIANLGDFGLQPAVMTLNLKKGWEVASQIRGGCINVGTTTTSHRSDTVPFGGIGKSGIGKEGSLAGVRELCHEVPYKFYIDKAS